VQVLIVNASPRRDGNSQRLGQAALEGVHEAGHAGDLVHLDDHVRHFIRDCRTCRDAGGACTIDDGYERLLRERVLPADALVLATPLYWYGMSAQLKTFFDRMFCFIAASAQDNQRVVAGLVGKRLALLVASEETYPGASLGIVHQVQEYARYTRSQFVGVVRGIGNRRGDVECDPSEPLLAARELGRTIAERTSTDYRIDTERPGSTWASLAAGAGGRTPPSPRPG
jgi:multimeric flavodoxin WrbA